ncbi:hypothetical protein BDL97_11G022100 [Sphagnum fallax]|nr:hypothetical protein BDL97_11G022100 [Sphagnum fallax]
MSCGVCRSPGCSAQLAYGEQRRRIEREEGGIPLTRLAVTTTRIPLSPEVVNSSRRRRSRRIWQVLPRLKLLPSPPITVTATSLSPAFPNECAEKGKKTKWSSNKTVDVTTLGNLCVDIVLNVPQLPPASVEEKFTYMKRLVAAPPDESYWEGGGNCNLTIAGARLGLHCVTLGHVGNEKFGHFLHRVLENEGIEHVDIQEEDNSPIGDDDYDGSTLLCWVLVDPSHQHAFCSRFDFNKNPAFSRIKQLPAGAKSVIQKSKALFVNGFAFDELAPSVVLDAMMCAQEAGCAVAFDPGPRAHTLFRSTVHNRNILEQLLCLCDILLLTADEAEVLTGMADPLDSATALLSRGKLSKWVVLKLGADGCLIATSEGIYGAPAFKVDVVDTVGCGDSFAAAVMLGYNMRVSVPITTTIALANAVGAATAMGQGAGRNVASAAKVTDILSGIQQQRGKDSEEHLSISSFGTIMPDASPVKPFSIPMHTAAHDALNLLNVTLNKSHSSEMLV